MSIEAVRQFNEIAKSDLEIQGSLELTTDVQSLMDLTVILASERGFSFTSEDLAEYYSEESRRLPDISLRNVMLLTKQYAFESDPDVCYRLPFLAREICRKLNS
ncbi:MULTISPECIES: Nif11-like leader peptide family natural product precursor [Microcystis]|uniref:Nif11 family protein n=1 Tax=Microcystis aeruginosa BLCC-F108 TaxID=2755317 RepID=A0A841UPI8_MICAE|nr:MULTISPECIES: Nif11-like leader peptide family natural product precursor [Microcystis]MBC1190187.1 Nif11 family protein [Microcystis aeruginosa BLCC-F108]MCA2589548.1 Nif11-like leader peptide family natural product precursor [Microcystis sp. M31BS1]MDB9408494.1 Nif11-like leader peptide family natural product precursor [Microcystis aeruginosa CS-558/01A06]